MKKEADFQKIIGAENKIVRCELCPHYCKISEGKKGICQVRKNFDGQLYSINYGEVTSIGIDPIEKKPLYHFYPGSKILSLGTYGCNFHCDFCQNWQISQEKPATKKLKPEEVVNLAIKKEVNSIAYTYSEPLVWYEFVKDTAKLASENGIKNVLVTNAYINSDPLIQLLPYIDAANVDLKAFNSDFYKNYTGGDLKSVKNNIIFMADEIHLEITTLVIDDLNSDREELEKLFKWIADINSLIPLHLSRYFPAYKINKSTTNISTMEKAYDLAKKYLNYVYLGNVRSLDKSNTFCPECGHEVISRNGYQTKSNLANGKCPVCNYEIYGQFI